MPTFRQQAVQSGLVRPSARPASARARPRTDLGNRPGPRVTRTSGVVIPIGTPSVRPKAPDKQLTNKGMGGQIPPQMRNIAGAAFAAAWLGK